MRTTVIIPSLDRRAMLHRCLDSTAAMKAQPDETIVVLQGTADPIETTALIARHPGVSVHWIARRGASVARNAGAAVATGQLFLFLDDDCVVDPAWLLCYLCAFAADPQLQAAGGQVRPCKERDGLAVGLQLETRPRTIDCRINPVGTIDRSGNLAIRAQAFHEVGGFDERLGPGTPLRSAEDTDLIYRLMQSGARLRYLPEAVVYHDQWRSAGQAAGVEHGYGIGLGGFLIRHIRCGDLYAASLAPRLLFHLGVRPFVDGLLRWRRDRIRSGLRYLVAIPRGMIRGLVRR